MKVIDGIELIKMFQNGEVNNKTKIKCVDWITDYKTEVHFNSKGILKWDVSNNVLTQEHLKYHFEIVKEEKEIEKIEITSDVGIVLENDVKILASEKDLLFANKINELVRELNKIKKEGK